MGRGWGATYRRRANFDRSGFDPHTAALFSQKRDGAVEVVVNHYLTTVDDEAPDECFEEPADEVTIVAGEGRP